MTGTVAFRSRRVVAQLITGALVVGKAGQLVGLAPQFRGRPGDTVLDVGSGAGHMALTFAVWCSGMNVLGAEIERLGVVCAATNIRLAIEKLANVGLAPAAASITLGHVNLDYLADFEPITAAYCYVACPELSELCAKIVATTKTLRLFCFVAPHDDLLTDLLTEGLKYEDESERPLLLQAAQAEGGTRGFKCVAVPVTENVRGQVLARLREHLQDHGRAADQQLAQLLRLRDTPMHADFTTLHAQLGSERFFQLYRR
jgi:hypothetical protein